MYARVLTNVERREVKSEGTHFPQKRINDELSQPQATGSRPDFRG